MAQQALLVSMEALEQLVSMDQLVLLVLMEAQAQQA
jgi:hypothetical protein